eukprot:3271991-Pyramimonas_sp.AAC.1
MRRGLVSALRDQSFDLLPGVGACEGRLRSRRLLDRRRARFWRLPDRLQCPGPPWLAAPQGTA